MRLSALALGFALRFLVAGFRFGLPLSMSLRSVSLCFPVSLLGPRRLAPFLASRRMESMQVHQSDHDWRHRISCRSRNPISGLGAGWVGSIAKSLSRDLASCLLAFLVRFPPLGSSFANLRGFMLESSQAMFPPQVSSVLGPLLLPALFLQSEQFGFV